MANHDILQLIKSLGEQAPLVSPHTDLVAYRETVACRLGQSPKQPVDFVFDDQVSTGKNTIAVRYYRHGRSINAQPTLIYFHGGGFVSGTLDTHDSICRRLARDTGWIIVSVDYRLAPENPYPAAVDDGLLRFVPRHLPGYRSGFPRRRKSDPARALSHWTCTHWQVPKLDSWTARRFLHAGNKLER